MVLAGASVYFKTAFSSNWNTGDEVTFTVQENEIVAFKAVLSFFYTSVIPEDMLICDVLKMFRLGDVLICSYLLQKIERRLVASSPDIIENNDLVSYFNLKVISTELDNKFQQLLVTRLGNLHKLMNIEFIDPQHLFLQLPVRGILALFSEDRLFVTSENEVLMLLVLWITKSKNKYTTEDLLELRNKCVRVCHLDMTIINEVLKALEWFKLTEFEKCIVHAYAAIINNGVRINSSTPVEISPVWFKKREYRLGLPPSSFLLHPVIIRRDKSTEFRDGETFELSDCLCWRGYSVMYSIHITKSNVIEGSIDVTFPQAYNEALSVFVMVVYNVKINGVEYGPFQQFSRDTEDIKWREQPLSEEERNHENGVIVEVRVIEFHC